MIFGRNNRKEYGVFTAKRDGRDARILYHKTSLYSRKVLPDIAFDIIENVKKKKNAGHKK